MLLGRIVRMFEVRYLLKKWDNLVLQYLVENCGCIQDMGVNVQDNL